MKKVLLSAVLALYSQLVTAQLKDTLSATALYLRVEAIKRLPPDINVAERVADLSRYTQSSANEYTSLLEEAARIAVAHGRSDLLAKLNEAKSKMESRKRSAGLHLPSPGQQPELGLPHQKSPARNAWTTHDPEKLKVAYQEAVRFTAASGDQELLKATKITYADHLVSYGSKTEGIDMFRGLATEGSLSVKDRIHILSQLVIHLFKLNHISEANSFYAQLLQSGKEGMTHQEEEGWLLATALYHECGGRNLQAKAAYWHLRGNDEEHSIASLEASLRLAMLYSRLLQRDSAEVYFDWVSSHYQTLSASLQYEHAAAYQVHQQRFRQAPPVSDWMDALRFQDSQYHQELVRVTRELTLQNQVLESSQRALQAEQQQQINTLKHGALRQRFVVTVLVLCLITVLAMAVAYAILLRKRQSALLHRKEVERLQVKHRHDVQQVLSRAQESERGRIAGQLHDEIGTMLSVVRLNLSTLKNAKTYTANEQAKLDTADQLLGALAVTIRDMSHQLMPVAIREYGLKQAIRQLVADINAAGNLFVEEVIVGLDGIDHYPEEFSIGLYRIVQEVLQNTIKHSGANRAILQVVEHEDLVSIMVEDNGRGILPEEGKKGLGLQLLRSRVDYLQGRMVMETGSEGGLLVSVELPLTSFVQ